MARERTTTIRCAETGCTETNTYAYTSQREYGEIYTRQRDKPWKCTRHNKPDEVLRLDNPEITAIFTADKLLYGNPPTLLPSLYWRSESGVANSSLMSGPGFKAHTSDFPEGTRVIVTARVEIPDHAVD